MIPSDVHGCPPVAAKKSSVMEDEVRCPAAAVGGIAADRKLFAALASGTGKDDKRICFLQGWKLGNSRPPPAAYHWRCFWTITTIPTQALGLPSAPGMYPCKTSVGLNREPLGQDSQWSKHGTLESNNPMITSSTTIPPSPCRGLAPSNLFFCRYISKVAKITIGSRTPYGHC